MNIRVTVFVAYLLCLCISLAVCLIGIYGAVRCFAAQDMAEQARYLQWTINCVLAEIVLSALVTLTRYLYKKQPKPERKARTEPAVFE